MGGTRLAKPFLYPILNRGRDNVPMVPFLTHAFNACADIFRAPSPNPGHFAHDDFTRSTLVDDNKKPITQYHATTADFRSFAPLSHFGTAAAALHRLKSTYLDNPNHFENGFWGPNYSARTIKAQLNIQNPLSLPDLGSHGPHSYKEALVNQGIITPDEGKTIFSTENKNSEGWQQRLVNHLMTCGYDGIAYKNDVEDAGSDSYIIFRPEQVKIEGTEMVHNPFSLKRLINAINPPPRVDYIDTRL